MEKLNDLNYNESSCAVGKQINVERARKLEAVEKYVGSLLHACRCEEASCQSANCRTMKRVVRHTRTCRRRASACPTCRQLVAVCCCHATHCQQAQCPVPFCANVKRKLAQQPPLRATSVRRKLAATSIQQMESMREDGLSRSKETLRELVAILKSRDTPDKQAQILHMLESNACLVNALLKLRQSLALKRSASQQQRQQQRPAGRRGEWLKQQLQVREDRMQPGESAIRRLIHAAKCKDPNCRLVKCGQMKRVLGHAKTCERRTTAGGCRVCKQLVALCCNHAKHCLQDHSCTVPFCQTIKRKLESRRLRELLQLSHTTRIHPRPSLLMQSTFDNNKVLLLYWRNDDEVEHSNTAWGSQPDRTEGRRSSLKAHHTS